MSKIFLLLSLPFILLAKSYEGCGENSENAKIDLITKISSTIEVMGNKRARSTRNDEIENVQTTIEQYSSVSSNLELVDIKIYTKETQVCATVEAEAQTEHTKKLLAKVRVYSESDLPQSSSDKLSTLKRWLNDLEQLEHLYPVFLSDMTNEEKVLINQKLKLFQDIYTQTQMKMDALVWKSCKPTRDEALKGLNHKLFNKKNEDTGFFDSLSKFFTAEEKDPLIHLLEPQISYTQSGTDICAVISKVSLLDIAQKMYSDAKRYKNTLLHEDPKKRYLQIDNYIQHLQVTTSLIALFPQSFSSPDKNTIDEKIKSFSQTKKSTYPQFVVFTVQSENPETIILDGKIVAKNEKVYIKEGEHSYKITAKDRCDITGSFSIDLFEEESISGDFSSMHYPTILFITDKSATAMVNGDAVALNKTIPIKRCKGEVQYLVKFASQSKMETITLEPEKKFSVVLNFLNTAEIGVFNDAKTKHYTTLQNEKFSESLTPIQSQNLKFDIETSPKNGSLNLNESGHFVYEPNEGFSGSDSFEYTITSPEQESSPRVVIIKVESKGSPFTVHTPILQNESDKNTTVEKYTELKEESKEEIKKSSTEVDEEKYQRFKNYVNSQEQNIEKLQKLQQKYPDMFQRLLQEKLAP